MSISNSKTTTTNNRQSDNRQQDFLFWFLYVGPTLLLQRRVNNKSLLSTASCWRAANTPLNQFVTLLVGGDLMTAVLLCINRGQYLGNNPICSTTQPSPNTNTTVLRQHPNSLLEERSHQACCDHN